jgi:hypothetical protein
MVDPGPAFGWTPPVPTTPASPPARPAAVTAAAIVVIVIGVLVTLLGLLVVLVAGLLGSVGYGGFGTQFGNLPAAVGGLFAIIGVIFAAFGVLEVVSGIYILSGRAWARITAIILSVLGGLFSLTSVASAQQGTVFFPIIFLLAYVFVIWALAVNGRYFASRGSGAV